MAEHKTQTQQPAPDTYSSPSLVDVPQGGILGLVAAIVGGVLYLRRRVSNDNKVIATDSAETLFITRLQEELEKTRLTLDRVYTERNALMVQIGGLQERVRLQDERIRQLERKLGIDTD